MKHDFWMRFSLVFNGVCMEYWPLIEFCIFVHGPTLDAPPPYTCQLCVRCARSVAALTAGRGGSIFLGQLDNYCWYQILWRCAIERGHNNRLFQSVKLKQILMIKDTSNTTWCHKIWFSLYYHRSKQRRSWTGTHQDSRMSNLQGGPQGGIQHRKERGTKLRPAGKQHPG